MPLASCDIADSAPLRDTESCPLSLQTWKRSLQNSEPAKQLQVLSASTAGLALARQRWLASLVGGSCYDLDRALDHDQKQYVSALRLPELVRALTQLPRPLFVSGICLLEALDRAGVSLDAHVYVKRMATWGWADEDELSGKPPEVEGASGAPVRIELRAYHEKWEPHLVEDYEFQRLS